MKNTDKDTHTHTTAAWWWWTLSVRLTDSLVTFNPNPQNHSHQALMVCTLAPTPASMPETLASLRFASKVNAVVTDKRADSQQRHHHRHSHHQH